MSQKKRSLGLPFYEVRYRCQELADTLAQFADDGRSVGYLWVLSDNARARHFYERHGWVSDETTKKLEIAGAPVPEMRYSRRIG